MMDFGNPKVVTNYSQCKLELNENLIYIKLG